MVGEGEGARAPVPLVYSSHAREMGDTAAYVCMMRRALSLFV